MAPPDGQDPPVLPTGTGGTGGGGNPTPVQQQMKHPKIPLFFGLPNGKDEIKARDLVARIEAHCTATGTNTQCSELYLVLRGNAVAWYNSLAIMGVDVRNWDALKANDLS